MRDKHSRFQIPAKFMLDQIAWCLVIWTSASSIKGLRRSRILNAASNAAEYGPTSVAGQITLNNTFQKMPPYFVDCSANGIFFIYAIGTFLTWAGASSSEWTKLRR